MGLVLATVSAVAIYFASRPPRYLTQYEAGLRYASNHEFEQAADYFAASARKNPQFIAARFELGRTHIAQKEFDLAQEDFHKVLKQQKNDTRSMAYIGYCFNLKRFPTAAIPWYELAIKNGSTVPEVFNNLGASYIDGSSTHSPAERLNQAEALLLRAIAVDPSSTATRLNLVRFAVTKSNFDPTYNPMPAWPHVKVLIDKAPIDQFVEVHVAKWHQAVLNWQTSRLTNRQDAPPGSSAVNTADQKRLDVIYHRVHSKNPLLASPVKYNYVARYFLDPIPPPSGAL